MSVRNTLIKGLNCFGNAKGKTEKDFYRRELYEILKPLLLKWIWFCGKRDEISYNADEILSMSWECFVYGLKYYDKNREVDPIYHFFRYTDYCLKAKNKEEEEYRKFFVFDYATDGDF